MKRWKKLGIAVVIGALVVTIAACAPQTREKAESSSGSTEVSQPAEGAVIKTGDHSWETWQTQYPDQYETFIRGIDDVEQWDGKVHGHAALYFNIYSLQPNLEQFGTSCIACKSTTGTELYNEMGVDAFMNDWDTYASGDKVDWYDCGLCHTDGTPGAELKPNGMAFAAFGAPLAEQVSAKEAVCGQCHNYIGAVYTRGGLMKKIQAGEADINSMNPWRYGFDPESLMKAALEDGYVMQEDPETGIPNFQANHPEIEVFQGSIHQQQGMTCVDCHGVKMEGTNGEFTSHGFSESPLENEEAIAYCLTCHEAQGVKNTDEMKEFVANAQQEMADAEAAFKEKQKELQNLIVNTDASDPAKTDALQQAKDNYVKATWFVRYADGGGDFEGMKIAHNPEGEMDCVAQATDLVNEGIALLS